MRRRRRRRLQRTMVSGRYGKFLHDGSARSTRLLMYLPVEEGQEERTQRLVNCHGELRKNKMDPECELL